MDFHEFANIFPLMCEEELNSLVEDIQANGLQDKEIITFEGKIADGRNRYRACGKLGIKPYVFVEWKKRKDELLVYILSKNLHRRHLNESQRAMIAVRLKPLFEEKAKARQLAQLKQNRNETVLDNSHKRKEPIHSHKEAGKVLNVSGKSVQRAEKVVNNGNPELIKAIEQGKITVSGAMKITDKPIDYQNSVIEKIDTQKARNVKDAQVLIKREKRAERKSFIPDEIKNKSQNFELYCRDSNSCDFDFLEPGSIDFIITDPPYPKEYINLYETLAKIGNKYLKDGGSLMAMAGQLYLVDILNLMIPHLNYHWTISYLIPGQSPRIWQRNVFGCWKPVLWFTKGKYQGDWAGDVVKSQASDKRFHEWGQSESGMSQIIESFTCPGDVILDPFLGGGTTGIVAVRLHRKFIGIDIDKNAVAIATERFNNEFLDVAV